MTLTIWTYIRKIWEERNKGVHEKQKAKGKFRDNEFMEAKAFQLIEKLREIQEIEEEKIQQKLRACTHEAYQAGKNRKDNN